MSKDREFLYCQRAMQALLHTRTKNLALRFSALALVSCLAACAAGTATISSDYDTRADFAAYRTYSWISAPDGGSPLMPQRVLSAIDARLQAAGWKLVPEGQVHVSAHVTTREGQTYDTFYSGLGHDISWLTGANVPSSFTRSTGSYQAGTLVVDMFDAKTRHAIWRGSASGVVADDAAQRDRQIQGAVDRLFAGFPPGGARP